MQEQRTPAISLPHPFPHRRGQAALAHPALRDIRTSAYSSGNRGTLRGRLIRSRGFTLIEVLVVVVILGILAGLIVPRIMDAPDKARAVEAKSNINGIVGALKMYRLDNGVYPSNEQGLQALVRRPESGDIPRNWKSGGYLERLPKDPWGREYQYSNPGAHGEVDVFTYGADGQPGGDGINADVGSWDVEQR